MKYLLSIAAVLFFGCKRQAYQNQDIKYMSGEWKIVKVTSKDDTKTTLYENFGSFNLEEDGTGSMEINSIDYSATGEKVSCIFTFIPIKGIDYSFDLRGLKKVDAQGKATAYLCNDGELHVRLEKQKHRKMVFRFDQMLANTYPCLISGYQLGKGDILWYLERK